MWLSANRAAKRIGVSRNMIPRIANAAGIRRRRLPGEKIVRYDSDDLDRVARESVIETGEAGVAVAS